MPQVESKWWNVNTFKILLTSALVDSYKSDVIHHDRYSDCLFFLGKYEEMLDIFQRMANLSPHLYLVRAAALTRLGRIDEARISIDDYHTLDDEKSDTVTFVSCHMRMVARPEDRELWLDGYSKASIPV